MSNNQVTGQARAEHILLVGGGTGGHVFPMIAVADALRGLRPDLGLVFVGTKNGLEAQVVPARGYRLGLIEAAPMRGGGPLGTLRGAFRALGSLGKARSLIARYQPRVVFSLGGYVAGALSVAARLSKTPLALMEPNSVAGFANRAIAPFVQRAYIAFDETQRHFSKKIVLRSGVALRSGFEPQAYAPSANNLKVLVLGGSQGARTLNEMVPRAIARSDRVSEVVHQVGRGNASSVKTLYDQLTPQPKVSVVEFIEDMPKALQRADLIISRAGASAVSEICAIGRPSLLIPYPFAADDHQAHNALALQNAGAAVCLNAKEANVERITNQMEELCGDVERLTRMARAAREWGQPRAAELVARDLLQLGGLVTAHAGSATMSDGGSSDLVRRVAQHPAGAH
jgi:UDP-N-acetylglucosamine--N-acetylmuramyl-(pentapeptide) pyrophosphoryl-undecaprenol N-acetylglucosamine transferase